MSPLLYSYLKSRHVASSLEQRPRHSLPQIPSNNPALAPLASIGAAGYSNTLEVGSYSSSQTSI